jgi:hypothetical protein
MAAITARKVRHRNFDRLRQKLWAVPAWVRLCVLHRGAAKPAARARHNAIR